MRHDGGKKWSPQKAGKGGKSIKIQIRDGPSSATLSPFLSSEFDILNTELIAAEISCETLQEAAATQNTCPCAKWTRGNLGTCPNGSSQEDFELIAG